MDILIDGKSDDVRVTLEAEPMATDDFAYSDYVKNEAKGAKHKTPVGDLGDVMCEWTT